MKIKVLTDKQLQDIHETSLKILDEIGIQIENRHVLDILEDSGAKVNKTTKVVQFPENVVMNAIGLSPPKRILYGRDPNKQARYGYGEFNALSSAGQYVWVDLVKKERRPASMQDMVDSIKVADTLENINIVGSFVIPRSIPQKTRDIHILAEMIKYTTKPLYLWINNGRTAKYVIELLKLIDADNFIKKPLTEVFIELVSPLKFNKESLEVLVEFAKIGYPMGFGPMAMTTATAPGTLAGTIAQENAEILAGIVIVQLIHPGTSCVYWGIPHIMDPKTGNISFGSPEQGLMSVAMVQLAEFYGLPRGVNVGLTDSKLPDGQFGLEKAATIILGALAGTDIFGHMGICGADQGASLAQLIIDNEILGYVKRIQKRFEVDENTLGFETMKKVGIGGNYLTQEHTLLHYRNEIWIPELLDRNNFETWKSEGAKTILDRALAKQEKILQEYRIDPVDDNMVKEINEIVKAADRDILGGKTLD